jgi:uncharacterized OB-fold protein
VSENLNDWTAGEPRIVLQSCDQCGRYRYLPRQRCEACGVTEATAVPAGGEGTCVGFSVLIVTADRGQPVRLALVELAEGAIAMTRADADVRAGDRVSLRFDDATGVLLPVATRTATR